MSEQSADSKQVANIINIDKPSLPLLYLSNKNVNKDSLTIEAFHEPAARVSLIKSTRPEISVILFKGGVMSLGKRDNRGIWRESRLRSGDLILNSNTGIPYQLHWKSLSAITTQTLHLRISKELIDRTAIQLFGYDCKRIELINRVGFQDRLLAGIGFTLWQELEQGTPIDNLYAQTITQLITIHILRHYSSLDKAIKSPSRGLTQNQLNRVVDYMQSHLNQELSLAVLAEQTGFSSYHFARLFRQKSGESPHQFIVRLRIERAQLLLRKNQLSLAEIALECGFTNQSHFTQVFKRQLGLTPLAYRREYNLCASF